MSAVIMRVVTLIVVVMIGLISARADGFVGGAWARSSPEDGSRRRFGLFRRLHRLRGVAQMRSNVEFVGGVFLDQSALCLERAAPRRQI